MFQFSCGCGGLNGGRICDSPMSLGLVCGLLLWLSWGLSKWDISRRVFLACAPGKTQIGVGIAKRPELMAGSNGIMDA